MNRLAALAVVALSLTPLAAHADPAPAGEITPDAASMTVKQGTTTRLRLKGLIRVAIGDPSIADVRVRAPDLLMIDGKHPGHTTLLVWTGPDTRSAYDVTVIR